MAKKTSNFNNQISDIVIYDVFTGEMIEILRGHTDAVMSLILVVSKIKGYFLASASADKKIRLWIRHKLGQSRVLGEHQGRVNAIVNLQYGSRIASGSSDKTVRISNILFRHHYK